jgi:uncharacterized protein involved in outer membrane biogenesis
MSFPAYAGEFYLPNLKKEKTMFKKIFIGIVALVVVVAIAGYLLFSNLDYVVKAGIENYGTKATQTKVNVGAVDIMASEGRVAIRSLVVGSPEGFSAPNTLNLGAIIVKLDTQSVTNTKEIIISEIIIDSPEINYELLANGKNNLQTIAQNAQNYANSLNKKINDVAGSDNNSAESDKPERKIIISNLEIRGAKMAITQPILEAPIATTLPTIKLTNIGKDAGGATAAQVAQQVISAITKSATQAAGTEIFKQQLGDKLNVDAISSGAGEAGKELGNKLKGLFGN